MMTIHNYNPYRRSGEEWLELHGKIQREELHSVRGHIVDAQMDIHNDGTGRDHDACITYRYKYGGRTYTEAAVFRCQDRHEAVELLEYYRSGATVGVFFDPTTPKDSLLGPHVPSSSTLVMIAMMLFVFVSLVTIVLLLGMMSQTV